MGNECSFGKVIKLLNNSFCFWLWFACASPRICKPRLDRLSRSRALMSNEYVSAAYLNLRSGARGCHEKKISNWRGGCKKGRRMEASLSKTKRPFFYQLIFIKTLNNIVFVGSIFGGLSPAQPIFVHRARRSISNYCSFIGALSQIKAHDVVDNVLFASWEWEGGGTLLSSFGVLGVKSHVRLRNSSRI